MYFLFSIFIFLVAPLKMTYAAKFNGIPETHHLMLSQHSCEVLGIGSACIDLLVPVSEEFLKQVPGEKGGAQSIEFEALNDIIYKSKQEPYIATGGSSANTIKGLANLNVKCSFLSTIGEDKLGNHYSQYMQNIGVVPLFYRSHLPTARVLCLVTPDGQRTMRFFAGSNAEMKEHILHPDYLKKVKLVHIDSYCLRNGNLVKRAMELAKMQGAKISLDLSSFEIVRQYKETIKELLRDYVDIVFANEDETKEFTGLPPHEGCIELQKICPIVVVLMGKKGCLAGQHGKMIASPAYPAQVIDTTGSGDLFASGFLYGLLQGHSLEDCAQLGNRLGGAITEVIGADLPQETWQTIKELFHSLYAKEANE